MLAVLCLCCCRGGTAAVAAPPGRAGVHAGGARADGRVHQTAGGVRVGGVRACARACVWVGGLERALQLLQLVIWWLAWQSYRKGTVPVHLCHHAPGSSCARALAGAHSARQEGGRVLSCGTLGRLAAIRLVLLLGLRAGVSPNPDSRSPAFQPACQKLPEPIAPLLAAAGLPFPR
jgi:hypothetical protein